MFSASTLLIWEWFNTLGGSNSDVMLGCVFVFGMHILSGFSLFLIVFLNIYKSIILSEHIDSGGVLKISKWWKSKCFHKTRRNNRFTYCQIIGVGDMYKIYTFFVNQTSVKLDSGINLDLATLVYVRACTRDAMVMLIIMPVSIILRKWSFLIARFQVVCCHFYVCLAWDQGNCIKLTRTRGDDILWRQPNLILAGSQKKKV